MSEYLWVDETYINATAGYQFGNSEPYETFTDSRAELFRYMQTEYGRCIARVYIDTADGTRPIGWVFQRDCVYEDARPDHYTRAGKPVYAERAHYTREVWVTVLGGPDTVTRERNYA